MDNSLSLRDIEVIADIHIKSLPNSFLASLGAKFLILIYIAIRDSDNSFIFVERKDDEVCGFISGGTGLGPIYKKITRQPIKLCLCLLPVLSFRTFCKVFEILTRNKKLFNSPQCNYSGELYSIAVRAPYQSTGVGKILLRKLSSEFCSRGVDQFYIYVGDSLFIAKQFYERNGAIEVKDVVASDGEKSIVYVMDAC